MYASYSKLSKQLKNGIEILVCQAFFKLRIKTVKILFWSITKEPPGLLLSRPGLLLKLKSFNAIC